MADRRMRGSARPVLLGVLAGLSVLILAAVAAVSVAPFNASVGAFHVVLSKQRPHSLAGAATRVADESAALGESADPVRSVVLFIGDGMGVGQVSTAASVLGEDLSITRAPVTGFLRTATADAFVTDSAAGATAFATGFRTREGMLSVLPDGRRPRTLFEVAHARGLATGFVTTSGLLDATPAAFTAHAASRDDLLSVARGMVASGADLMLGGDWGLPARAARDGEAAKVMEVLRGASGRGYTIVTSGSALASNPPGPMLGLFPQRAGHPGGYGPPLAETTSWALSRLANDNHGFILLVESEETDEAGHRHDLGRLVDGVHELDAAVAAALEFAGRHRGTLVLITADHDCGGVGVVGGGPASGGLDVAWASSGHTGQWVPVFAFGAGAGRFTGVHDNTFLARSLASLLELPGFPDAG